ncbi:MAG: UDP-N-acetylmuramate dehydrogenase, partial [Candidatus Gallimonas sp.]
ERILDFFSVLDAGLPDLTRERAFSFARHTTIGCGGTAAAALCPAGTEETAKALSFLKKEGIPYCFLGAGANVLPAEGNFEGAVVRFCAIKTLFAYGTHVFAGAGVTLGALVKFTRERALSGFEPLTGIPASVGGATVMNAGVSDRHMSDLIEKVVAVEDGKILLLDPRECAFSEKRSLFQKGVAVTGVLFRGVRSEKERIAREIRRYRAKRAALPKGRSMGCVFVNPESCPAGKLLDECGLKGRRIGGAYVSREHANFILNEGGTSTDVALLVSEMKREVYAKTGILLREEIRYIP